MARATKRYARLPLAALLARFFGYIPSVRDSYMKVFMHSIVI
jgi:hypothetical protein